MHIRRSPTRDRSWPSRGVPARQTARPTSTRRSAVMEAARSRRRSVSAMVRVPHGSPANNRRGSSSFRKRASDPSIVIVWTAKAEGGTRLVSARSDDGGLTFSAPALVPGTDAPGNRGWESAAADSAGGVATLWLDHRELATTGGAGHDHSDHQHVPRDKSVDGAARAQSSKLFFARLGDATSARSITGGVCYCCKTTMAVDADGTVYAAWRHVFEGNIRDIAFTMSADGGRTFAPAGPCQRGPMGTGWLSRERPRAGGGRPSSCPRCVADAAAWRVRFERTRTWRCSMRCRQITGSSPRGSGFRPKVCRAIRGSRRARAMS